MRTKIVTSISYCCTSYALYRTLRDLGRVLGDEVELDANNRWGIPSAGSTVLDRLSIRFKGVHRSTAKHEKFWSLVSEKKLIDTAMAIMNTRETLKQCYEDILWGILCTSFKPKKIENLTDMEARSTCIIRNHLRSAKWVEAGGARSKNMYLIFAPHVARSCSKVSDFRIALVNYWMRES